MRQDTRPNEAPKRSSSTVRSSHLGSGPTAADLDDPARHGTGRDDGQDDSTDPAVERAGGVTTPTRGRRIGPRQGRRTVVRSRGGAGVHHGSGTVIRRRRATTRRRASAVARRIAAITGVGRRHRAVPEGNAAVVALDTIRLAGGHDVTDVGAFLDDLEREARPVRQRVVGTTHLDRSREVRRRRTLIRHRPRLGLTEHRLTHVRDLVVLLGVGVPLPRVRGGDGRDRAGLHDRRILLGRLGSRPIPVDGIRDRRVGDGGRIRDHDAGVDVQRRTGDGAAAVRADLRRGEAYHMITSHQVGDRDGLGLAGREAEIVLMPVPGDRVDVVGRGIRYHHRSRARPVCSTRAGALRLGDGQQVRRARGDGCADDTHRDQQADHDGCERLAKAEPEVHHLLACGGHSPSPPFVR